MSKNLCIIQARIGSTRLPNKVLMDVGGLTMLEYEINRVKSAKKVDKIVVATGDTVDNDEIEKFCKKINVDCFRGSESDVLKRYYECASQYDGFDNVIRITGDCPLIDPFIVDRVIGLYEKENCDYASNIEKETFPDGMDLEIFKKSVLKRAHKEAKLQSEREHVTLYIRNSKNFKRVNLESEHDWSHYRLTVDEQNDFEVIKFLIDNSKPEASCEDYITLLKKNPQIMEKNMDITRNEGLQKSLKNDFEIK